MSMEPLLAAPLTIQLHTAAAVIAASFGLTVILAAKGSGLHRRAGYGFVAAISAAALTSFGITEIFPGRFSAIHMLSLATLISLPLAIYFRRRGHIRAHAIAMAGPLIGLLFAGAATLLPGRILHAVFFG